LKAALSEDEEDPEAKCGKLPLSKRKRGRGLL
jgi:hypothetical protein